MHWMMMPLRRYAEFSGRSRRMEFWMWQLFKFLIGCAISILFLTMFGTALNSFERTGDLTGVIAAGAGMAMLWLLVMVIGLAIFIPDLAVTVRRLHDTDRSGWWILAPVAPYLLLWVVFVSTFSLDKQPAQPTGIAAILIFVAAAAVLVLALTLLVFYFLDGTPGPNRFGPDPKGRG